ncbi:hypothetical protein J6590_078648 [Homalodisca vitripennis]|nr:hypothetical protein J6590_078648 [Homalodisca vitripennis]
MAATRAYAQAFYRPIVNIDTRSRPPDTLLDSYRPSSDDVATINIVAESTLIPDLVHLIHCWITNDPAQTTYRPPDTLLDNYRRSSDDVAAINIVTESTLIPDLVHLIHCWITTDPAQTTLPLSTLSQSQH